MLNRDLPKDIDFIVDYFGIDDKLYRLVTIGNGRLGEQFNLYEDIEQSILAAHVKDKNANR
jgi:hypothetical protein